MEDVKFRNELLHLVSHQMAAFNSPVWYNVGTPEHEIKKPQISACFVNSIDDSMESILETVKTEGLIQSKYYDIF